MSAHLEAPAPGRHRSRRLAGVLFLLTAVAFWPTLASFPGTWGQYGMSHGWLVAGLVGWLLWRDRGELFKGSAGAPLALLPLAALSLFWFTTTVAHIQLFHQSAFVLLALCWGLVVFGPGSARILVALGVTSLLALPLWEVFVPVLRPVTTLASGGIARLLGIPVEIEGDVIRIASGTFIIADGCAGINYLLAGLVIGAFYAHILVRGWPAQIAVVGLAAVFAIVGNWIRVAGMVLIGHLTEMQSSLMQDHGWFGWVIFTVGLVPFFYLARRIETRAARKAAGARTEAGHAGSAAEVESTSPGGDGEAAVLLGSGEDGGPMKRALVASAVAVVGPVLYFVFGALPTADAGGLDLAGLARRDQWHVAELPGDRPFDWRPAYQGAEEYDSWTFTDGTALVYGDRFVYREQAQGAKLIGYPNRIAPGSDVLNEQLVGPVDPERRLWVQQAVIRTPEGPILTWYWYRVGGVDAFSPVYAKILEVPAFLTRRRASELIALSAACEPDNCRGAFEALAGFMGARAAGTPENPPG